MKPNDLRVEMVNISNECIKKIISICDNTINLKDNTKGWDDYSPVDMETNQDYIEKFIEDWDTLKAVTRALHHLKNNAGNYALSGVVVGISKILTPAGLLGKAWELGKSLFGKAGIKTEL